jgi:hypothetical protein
VCEEMPPDKQEYPPPELPADDDPDAVVNLADVALTAAPASLPASVRELLRVWFTNAGRRGATYVWQRKN